MTVTSLFKFLQYFFMKAVKNSLLYKELVAERRNMDTVVCKDMDARGYLVWVGEFSGTS